MPARDLTVYVTEADLYHAITELYNNGHFELVAEGGHRVMLLDGRTPCTECGERIPAASTDGEPSGSLANCHHADSCSLYDASEE